MKLDGDYLYPESPLEASVFLGCEFEQLWDGGKWHKLQALSVGDFPELSYNNEEPIRIHRSVAAPKLEYREGAQWSHDWVNCILIEPSEERPFPKQHAMSPEAAIFAGWSAEAFRELWAWKEGGEVMNAVAWEIIYEALQIIRFNPKDVKLMIEQKHLIDRELTEMIKRAKEANENG